MDFIFSNFNCFAFDADVTKFCIINCSPQLQCNYSRANLLKLGSLVDFPIAICDSFGVLYSAGKETSGPRSQGSRVTHHQVLARVMILLYIFMPIEKKERLSAAAITV